MSSACTFYFEGKKNHEYVHVILPSLCELPCVSVFLLFTVKPENSSAKVRSSAILMACKAVKKDLSNRLSLTAYESESAFELTGHLYSPSAVSLMQHLEQFQGGLVLPMCRWSAPGGSLAMEEQNSSMGTSALLLKPGNSQGKLLFLYRRKGLMGREFPQMKVCPLV